MTMNAYTEEITEHTFIECVYTMAFVSCPVVQLRELVVSGSPYRRGTPVRYYI